MLAPRAAQSKLRHNSKDRGKDGRRVSVLFPSSPGVIPQPSSGPRISVSPPQVSSPQVSSPVTVKPPPPEVPEPLSTPTPSPVPGASSPPCPPPVPCVDSPPVGSSSSPGRNAFPEGVTVVDGDGDLNVFIPDEDRLLLRVSRRAQDGTEGVEEHSVAYLTYCPGAPGEGGELNVSIAGVDWRYYSLGMPVRGLALQLQRIARLARECRVACYGFGVAQSPPLKSPSPQRRYDESLVTPGRVRDSGVGEEGRNAEQGLMEEAKDEQELDVLMTPRSAEEAPQPTSPLLTSTGFVAIRRRSVVAEVPKVVAEDVVTRWLDFRGAVANVSQAAKFLVKEGFTTEGDMELVEADDLIASGLRRCDVRRVMAAKASVLTGPQEDTNSVVNELVTKGPRVVQVGFTITQISSIDTVGASFTVSLKVFYIWFEPGLIGRQADDVDWEGMWTPRGYLKNQLECGEMERRVRAYDISTGGTVRGTIKDPWVIETVRYRTTLSQTMGLMDFPVDRQDLNITITSRNHTKKIEFQPCVVDNILETQELAGWTFPDFDTFFGKSAKDNTGKRYPEFRITLSAQRIVRFYLMNICAQLSLLCTTTFFTVVIAPAEFSDRVQLTVTMLLTAITFKMSVSEWVPRIGYLTLLDRYLMGTVMLIVVLMLENFLASLAVTLLDGTQKEMEAVRWMDAAAHAALFVLWVGSHCIAYYRIIHRRNALSYDEGPSPALRKSDVSLNASRAVAAFLIAGRHNIDLHNPNAGNLLERTICRIQAMERGRQVRRRILAQTMKAQTMKAQTEEVLSN
eukprot:Hpha_TRINITY_DN8430_c0_g1::TRINITY_DN8430_c0_g1_i1::g.34611::m.34611